MFAITFWYLDAVKTEGLKEALFPTAAAQLPILKRGLERTALLSHRCTNTKAQEGEQPVRSAARDL